MKPSGSFVLWDNTMCNPLAPAREQARSAWEDGYASGVAAEREACSKVCDTTPPYPFRPSIEAAHAIRARSNT